MGEKNRLEKLWQLHPNTFRHDAGSAWVGGKIFKAKKDGIINVKKGDSILINGTYTSYGIEGWGDRIGWTSVIITPEMVGKKVAIFTSIEDKSKTDKIGIEQLIFFINVSRAGGIAKIYKELKELTLDQILKLPRREDKKNRTPILERLLKNER